MTSARSEEYFARTGLRGWARDLRWAYTDRTPLPFSARLRATRAGFKPVSAVAYDFAHNDLHDYLPDTSWLPLAKTNGAAAAVLSNKLLFYREFCDELPLPRVYGYLAAGYVEPVADVTGTGGNQHGAAEGFDCTEQVLDHLREHGPLVLKPLGGDRGRGIHLLEDREGELHLDGRPVSAATLVDFLHRCDGSLLVEGVVQAEYSRQIFPRSANSLRLVVFAGAGAPDGPFIPVAGHRFGRESSAPVDNTSKGGLLSPLALDSATLGPGRYLAPGARAYQHFDEHPDTGARLSGVSVPRLDEVVSTVLEFSRRHAHFSYLSWDVVITPNGFTVLEVNHHGSLRMQVAYPYLKDERIVAFLDHHGIVPRHSRRAAGHRGG